MNTGDSTRMLIFVSELYTCSYQPEKLQLFFFKLRVYRMYSEPLHEGTIRPYDFTLAFSKKLRLNWGSDVILNTLENTSIIWTITSY